MKFTNCLKIRMLLVFFDFLNIYIQRDPNKLYIHFTSDAFVVILRWYISDQSKSWIRVIVMVCFVFFVTFGYFCLSHRLGGKVVNQAYWAWRDETLPPKDETNKTIQEYQTFIYINLNSTNEFEINRDWLDQEKSH